MSIVRRALAIKRVFGVQQAAAYLKSHEVSLPTALWVLTK